MHRLQKEDQAGGSEKGKSAESNRKLTEGRKRTESSERSFVYGGDDGDQQNVEE